MAKGSVEVDLKKIKITAGVGFSKTTLGDGRMVPYIKAVNVDMDIGFVDFGILILQCDVRYIVRMITETGTAVKLFT